MCARFLVVALLATLAFDATLPALADAQAPTYMTQWGGYGSGNGEFNSPTGIAVDASDNVYVVDSGNHRIQKFTSSGGYLTQWGVFGYGNGEFESPLGIAVDAAGIVYVTDRYRVEKFTSDGVYLGQWGSPGPGPGQFGQPFGLLSTA